MTGLVAIEITCPDDGTAGRIAEALVARRLAACTHLHPPIQSLYHWRGRIEAATEAPLVVKTRADLFDAVAAVVRALHPHEVPAITARPIAAATADYAAWLAAETAGPA